MYFLHFTSLEAHPKYNEGVAKNTFFTTDAESLTESMAAAA